MFKNAVSSAYRFFLATLLVTLVAAAVGIVPAHATGPLFVGPAAVGDCSSWANACSLQTALTSAISGDEIWVAAGTYTPITGTNRSATFQLKNGVVVYGGFAGTETLLTQRDPTTDPAILSGEIGAAGSGDNSYHVVTGATGATLDGFTITAGNADGSSPNNAGGGMYNSASSPTIVNVTFSANLAAMFGAGMYNSASSPVLTNVTFSANQSSMYGGGMFNNIGSNPVLTNVTFSSNQAVYTGGGMQNSSSNPVLTNVTFSANQATDLWVGGGGGMFNGGSSPVIHNAIFWGNTDTTGSISEKQIYTASGTPSVDYSVVEGGYASGTHIISTDPKLGTLGWYGGFTHTVPLLFGSSAINATSSNCPVYDQRGMNRSTPACDIGAFEYSFPSAPRIDTPTENSHTNLVRPLISGTAGAAEAYATVTVKEGAITLCSTAAAGNGSWSCTPTFDLGSGIHSLSVTQTDLANNTSLASTRNFTIPYLVYLPLTRH